jgi:hypothetical protein
VTSRSDTACESGPIERGRSVALPCAALPSAALPSGSPLVVHEYGKNWPGCSRPSRASMDGQLSQVGRPPRAFANLVRHRDRGSKFRSGTASAVPVAGVQSRRYSQRERAPPLIRRPRQRGPRSIYGAVYHQAERPQIPRCPPSALMRHIGQVRFLRGGHALGGRYQHAPPATADGAGNFLSNAPSL